jgi:F-type H+-transporting ATPase subunit epsilon
MLTLEVITPQGNVLSVDTEQVTAPGSEGEFQVLPSHLPMLVLLSGGRLSYRGAGSDGAIYLRGGVAEVNAEGHILVLTEEVQIPSELDVKRAAEIKGEVESRLEQSEYLTEARIGRLRQDLMYAEAILNA